MPPQVPAATRGTSRRAVALGTAWAIPALTAAGAAPALAASGCTNVPCTPYRINLEPTETTVYSSNGTTGYDFFGLPVFHSTEPCLSNVTALTTQNFALTITVMTPDNRPDPIQRAAFDYYPTSSSVVTGNSVTLTSLSNTDTQNDLAHLNQAGGQDFDSFRFEVAQRADPTTPFEIRLSLPITLSGGTCDGQTQVVTQTWYLTDFRSA